jgi:hypothetical protein
VLLRSVATAAASSPDSLRCGMTSIWDCGQR